MLLGVDVRAARYTWTAALVLLLLCVVYLIRETLFVFVIALMFAYLLYPLMDAIDRQLSSLDKSLRSRTPALALTYLLVIGLMVTFGVIVGSKVATQAADLTKEVRGPNFAEHVRQWRPIGFPIGAQLVDHYQQLLNAVPQISLKVLSASRNLIYLVVIPILSFFILKDGRRIRDGFLDFVNEGRQEAEETLLEAHTLLLQYMRALLFLCLATLVVFSVVLGIFGVPYAFLLAAIAFPLEFVPLLGPLVAAITIIAVSALSGYPHVLWVVIFLGIYRVFQDYVLSPHLMSSGVELHPLLVIFGVFAGGEIGGVEGVFLSVPVLALIRLGYHHILKQRLVTRVPVIGT